MLGEGFTQSVSGLICEQLVSPFGRFAGLETAKPTTNVVTDWFADGGTSRMFESVVSGVG